MHVALAAASLVGVSYLYAKLEFNYAMILFVFFATLSGYNLTKYGGYVFKYKRMSSFKKSLQAIIALTVLSCLICIPLVVSFSLRTQLMILGVAILNLLYVIPFKRGSSNLRNLAGIKIYIVSLCWALTTLYVPLCEASFSIDIDFFIKFIQRFILTLLLLLIFEINDLKYDDVHLKTIPQAIGISATKRLVYALALLFFILDLLKQATYAQQEIVNLFLMATVLMFTYLATPKRSKYYTLFWVESIPILWLLLMLFSSSVV